VSRFEDNPNALGLAGYQQRRGAAKTLAGGTPKPSDKEREVMRRATGRRREFDLDERN
jgi:hypothetical protein